MPQLNLSIATTDYDHFRDLRMGLVKPEGIDLNWMALGHHECFARFTANREFDLSELSFAKFTTQVTRKDSDIVGLPVRGPIGIGRQFQRHILATRLPS